MIAKVFASIVRKAIIGPIMTLRILVAFDEVISIYVIPENQQVTPVEQWPLLGRMLFMVANGIVKWGWLMTIILAFALYIFYKSLGHWTRKIRLFMDNYLSYRVYRDYQGASFIIFTAIETKLS